MKSGAVRQTLKSLKKKKKKKKETHLFVLKRFVNDSIRTLNAMVSGETGQYPLNFCVHSTPLRGPSRVGYAGQNSTEISKPVSPRKQDVIMFWKKHHTHLNHPACKNSLKIWIHRQLYESGWNRFIKPRIEGWITVYYTHLFYVQTIFGREKKRSLMN